MLLFEVMGLSLTIGNLGMELIWILSHAHPHSTCPFYTSGFNPFLIIWSLFLVSAQASPFSLRTWLLLKGWDRPPPPLPPPATTCTAAPRACRGSWGLPGSSNTCSAVCPQATDLLKMERPFLWSPAPREVSQMVKDHSDFRVNVADWTHPH